MTSLNKVVPRTLSLAHQVDESAVPCVGKVIVGTLGSLHAHSINHAN